MGHFSRNRVTCGRRRLPITASVGTNDRRAGGAAPRPRTAAAAEALQAPKNVKRTVRTQLLEGMIGTVAQTYFRWEDNLNLPDAEQALANPSKVQLPTRNDQQYAFLANVVSRVIGAPEYNTQDRWNAAWEVLALAAKAKNPDIAATQAFILAKNKPSKTASAPVAPMMVFKDVLEGAGVFNLVSAAA